MDDEYDLVGFLSAALPDLLWALAETHTGLAHAHVRIGFLRAEELRNVQHAKQERVQLEGERDALVEKKFLLLRLIDNKKGR